jgi:uncharacterized membrane protein
MTVTAVLASLAPILAETGIGSDVMTPIAAPIVGGMITSTIHVLILVPLFFVLMKERALRHGTLIDQSIITRRRMAEPRESPISTNLSSSTSHFSAIERIQWFTIAWMTIEAGISLFAAIRAHSIALAAFGADSAIELFSAATVLRRFRSTRQQAEALATKITAWLLIALAVYIATSSLYALIQHRRAETTYLGMAVLVAAAVIMPWLGKQKRRLAIAATSPALRADATQSSVCAYLAWIALTGLLLNAFAHVWWMDAVGALCLIPFVLKEARETFEGRVCQGCQP